ncbi:MAG: hypothetical protein ABWZ40_04955, partial [Caulobacterales bacterium]
MVVRRSILWRAPLAGAVAAAGISIPAPDFAQAADAGATITAKTVGGVFRIGVKWPESMADNPPAIGAELEEDVLVMRFSQPLNTDVSDLAASAPDMIRAARIDSNGKTLRIALKQTAKARVDSSYNIQAVDLTPPGFKGKYPGVDSPKAKKLREAAAASKQRADVAEAARLAAPPPVVDVSVGQAPSLTRIAFEWTKPVGYSVKIEGNKVKVRFNVRAKADIAEMRIDPPKFLKTATQTTDSRALEVVLETQDGVIAKHFRDGDYVVVDLMDKPQQSVDEALAETQKKPDEKTAEKVDPKALHPEQAAPEETPPTEQAALNPAPETTPPAEQLKGLLQANPLPADGKVKVEVDTSRRGAELAVTFAKPAAAAVFRRGQYIYAMFAADNAQFDLRMANGNSGNLQITPMRAPGVSGLRIKAPDNLYLSARPENERWIIKLTPQEMGAPEAISLAADDGVTGTELKASLPGAALLGAVIDPDTGARVDYAMAYGPPCGLLRERRFVEALALPTAHGAAFEAYADDLKFAVMQGSVRLRRNVGLQLTSQNGGSPLAAK